MSRTEAMVLISSLQSTLDDLRDLRWDEKAPQHVAAAAEVHMHYINEAIAELRRLHEIV